MADRNQQVMEMVTQELTRNPEVDLGTLYDRAQKIDPSINEISLRQFNARYPLQAKRALAIERGGGVRKRAPRAKDPRQGRARRRRNQGQDPNREAIRSVFLEFATDFAKADTRSEIVRVLSSVDRYVERVTKLTAQG